MDNYIFPFLWVHGETEEVYRKMVGVIYDSNIRSFCVEARPHPQFVKDQWWKDMEIILDEARKRGMKVWILDDKHFPTGFAAGEVQNAPLRLKRRTVIHKSIPIKGGKKITLSIKKYIAPKERYGLVGRALLMYGNDMKYPKRKKADELLCCVAYGEGRKIDLSPYIKNQRLDWQVPDGKWTVEICSLTYDSGFHRDYINMIDEESCRIQVEAVYEPHYEHFKDDFGKTIAGFFSDEPELGNGNYLKHYNYLGTEQSLPYSDELAVRLEEELGEDWKLMLPLLWNNDGEKAETARVRYVYMDIVTRLVEKCFSRQIGMWCREHGVEYIGHVIEDNNQHARTCTSLGHYFRGLKWQSMAGIDDIGGQVEPDKEDAHEKNIFGYVGDGEFYHFALGKLGSSLGTLNPNMEGRSMCEIFGNYGWKEGVHLEKYLVDHFMVRGINHFVPHAFTCSEYPEKDCPPHFYAQGHNPQYRHFGELMKYTNRICDLISGGRINEKIAILYHGESEWSGECMLMQKPARILAENQVDFCFLPSDVFEERDFYKTVVEKQLMVNGTCQSLVIVPWAEYMNNAAAAGLAEMISAGGKVAFIDRLPVGIATGEVLPKELKQADVIKLDELMEYISKLGLIENTIVPANTQIRVMNYLGRKNIFYIVNESSKKYDGVITLRNWTDGYAYDPWSNTVFTLSGNPKSGLKISLDAHESFILIEGKIEDSKWEAKRSVSDELHQLIEQGCKKESLTDFEISVCDNLSYPDFSEKKHITKLEGYELTDKKFAGIIRYETTIHVKSQRAFLEITEAYEGVEVFMNGNSAGIKLIPRYLYDLSEFCKEGENVLAIEVATTLEREHGGKTNHCGITGQVNLYQ